MAESATAAAASNDEPPRTVRNYDVPLHAKISSALVGSLMTSLLALVTPLDVVRVRLQSQQPQNRIQPRSNLTNVAVSAWNSSRGAGANTRLPPTVGVTECCREIFWVSNAVPARCIIQPNGSIAWEGAAPEAAARGKHIAPELCAVEEHQRRTITSTIDGLRKIARNEGLATLWRGLSPTLAMAVPGNVIYFAGYDWLRFNPQSPLQGENSMLKVPDYYIPLVGGSGARVVSSFSISPIELFRTRMQANRTTTSAAANFKATASSVKAMVQNEGIFSLWRGLTLTLWRDVPFSALYWWGYEQVRMMLTNKRQRNLLADPSSPVMVDENADEATMVQTAQEFRAKANQMSHGMTLVDSFIAGATSGAVSSIVTTPFDVGKTRLQIYNDSIKSSDRVIERAPESLSMPRFLIHIFKNEGLQGLFRGMVPRCLKVAPACAIMISSYEVGKRFSVG